MKQQTYQNVLLANRNRVDISIHVPKTCKKNESNSFKLFIRKTLFRRFQVEKINVGFFYYRLKGTSVCHLVTFKSSARNCFLL